MSAHEKNPADEALDRLLAEAIWPGSGEASIVRLLAHWRSLCTAVECETGSGESLDRLLAQAQWPQPGGKSLERLTKHWDSLSRIRQDRSSWWRWSAAAAVLLVAGGALWWGFSSRNERIADKGASDKVLPPQLVDGTTPIPIGTGQSAIDGPSWRTPNAYEMVLVAAARRERVSADPNTKRTVDSATVRRRRIAKTPQKSRPSQTLELAGGLKMVANVLGSIRATSELLEDLSGERAEAALIERVRTSDPVEQQAALRVLVPIATERSLPLLRAAGGSSALRSTVMSALLRLEDSVNLGQMALAESDPTLRHEIMAALWQREDPRAFAFMFALVGNDARRADALAALDKTSRPPVEWLCQIVGQSPRASDRTAAAELLGRLNRPEASQCLIELSHDAAGRQAALTGLLASSEPTARQFVAAAENDPYLVASIRTIRHHQTHHSIAVPGESPHGTP